MELQPKVRDMILEVIAVAERSRGTVDADNALDKIAKLNRNLLNLSDFNTETEQKRYRALNKVVQMLARDAVKAGLTNGLSAANTVNSRNRRLCVDFGMEQQYDQWVIYMKKNSGDIVNGGRQTA